MRRFKMLKRIAYSVLAFMLLVCLVLPIAMPSQVKADDAWWDANWLYRTKITVDHTLVDANLTNFTVLVKLTDGSNFTYANGLANGYDIRFVDDDGVTQYYFEREVHANPDSYYWVKMPTVSSTVDDSFYCYYGNPAAANASDAHNAWDANYKAVLHMTDYTTSVILDSTVNGNNGAKGEIHGWPNLPTETTTAEIYKAQNFTDTTMWIGGFGAVGTVFTEQMWFKPVAGAAPYPVLWSGYHHGTYGEIVLDQALYYRDAEDKLAGYAHTSNAGVYSDTDVLGNAWNFVAYTCYLKSDKMYHNDDAPVSNPSELENPSSAATSHCLGAHGGQQQFFKGIIDEYRWSNIERSAAWLHADYYSESNTLLSFSTGGGTPPPPEVTTVTASNILSTVARLNGVLTDEGAGACTVVIGWATASHAASFVDYTSNVTLGGTYNTSDSFYYDAIGLTSNTTYYFNSYAYNASANDTGVELSFTTGATASGTGIGCPTFFVGTPTDDSMSLTWVRGASTNTTYIRYMTGGSCATSNTTGSLLYNGGLTYYTLSGLDAGTTICFIAWGITPEGAWSSSNTTLLLTTLGMTAESDIPPLPPTPMNWITGTDYTTMSRIPFYDMINETIDNTGISREWAWGMIPILVAMVMAVLMSIWVKKLIVGVVILLIGLVVGVLCHLIPSWIILVTGLAIFALIGHRWRTEQ